MEPIYSQPGGTIPQPPSSAQMPVLGGGKPKHGLLIATILLSVFLVAFIGLFVWAFLNYQDHKKNVDGKVSEAVKTAEAAKTTELEAAFKVERERLFNKYTTNPVLANVTLEYPRDWSFYLEEDQNSSTQIQAIFHPTVVQNSDPGTYGMRLRLEAKLYSEVLDDFEKDIEDGLILVTPIKNGDTSGVRLDGQIDRDHNGSMIMFPIRDKTLIVQTDSKEYLSVYEEAIKKLVFTP